MTQRPSFYAFAGGLDETTQALAVPKGRVIACKNHESVDRGYGRVGGYERYDGRQSPTEAFRLARSIDQGKIDREAARAAIQRVPGSGPVRGVAVFEGALYAWRDNQDATAGAMWRATAAGWAVVDMMQRVAFTSGGAYEIVIGDTIVGGSSGARAIVKRVLVTSGAWKDGNAAGYLVVSPISGNLADEPLNIGVHVDAATATAATAQRFPAGGRYFTINHNFYGATNLKELYGCNGVGQAFAFDGESVAFISTGMVVDAPIRITEYKQHLFLGFPGGSVQHSEPGEPLQWNPVVGAGEIAVGSDITDFITSVNALQIFTVDSINTLTGSDAQDWVMQPLTTDEGTGAAPFTAQSIGDAIYLDAAGLRSITATQAFGNFKRGSLIGQIDRTLRNKRKAGIQPVASVRVKSKDHYRLFYADGTGISVFFGRKYPEPMIFDLERVVTCITSQTTVTDGERVFFGSEDGFVYELEVGTSYDGAPIEAYLQLPYDHEGSPWTLKRWHKIIMEMEANPATQIGMTAEFDYSDGEQRSLPPQGFEVAGGGGLWDVVTWDDFFWSAPAEGKAECYLDGQGSNMSLIIVSNSAEQVGYVLQGMTKMVSVRGQKR